jgi:predicted RNA binding protein YcfA (HicA-like mRNA interferase family)
MFQDAKQKPLQDVSELSNEQLTMVTGSGKKKNPGSIKSKDLSRQLDNAGFTPRPAKTGSHVYWAHASLPGQVIALDKKGSEGASRNGIADVRRAIQQVQQVGSSSQAEDGVIDIDKI